MEEEGQAQEQPATFDDSVAQARALLDAEDGTTQAEPVAAAEPAVEGEEAKDTPVEEVEKQNQQEETVQLDPDAPLFDIEVVKEGGIKEKVKHSLNQLIQERMLHADYTRKTQELSSERKSIPEQVKKLAEPQLKQAEAALMLANQVVTELVAPELAGMTPQKMAELSQTDPFAFAALLGKQNLVASTVQQISQRQGEFARQKEAERVNELAKSVQESVEKINQDIPGWNAEIYENLLNTGAEYGFQPLELGRVSSLADLKPIYFTDHRIIKMLADAQKYRELQKAKPGLEKKVVNVPKVIKPGTSEKPDPNADKFKNTMARLKKTGSTADAFEAAKLLL
ncbi:MAG TPA: hypothetical protein VIY48_16990 [Candidatus Paceibacterota bacterium]